MDKKAGFLASGKQQLAEGNYEGAGTHLTEAAKIAPTDSEVHFYLFVNQFLASMQSLDQKLGPILSLITSSSSGTSGESSGSCGLSLSGLGLSPARDALVSPLLIRSGPEIFPAPRLAGTVGTADLNGLIAPIVNSLLIEDMQKLRAPLEVVKQDQEFEIVLDSLPVTLGGTKILDLGGRYDAGEIYLFISLTHIIESLGHFVKTISLDLDLGAVLDLLCVGTDANSLLNGIVGLLNKSPNFLTLAPGGKDEMRGFVDSAFRGIGEIVNAFFVTATRRPKPDDFLSMETRTVNINDPSCATASTEDTKIEKRLCIIVRVKAGDGQPVEIGIPARRDLIVAGAGMLDALFQTCAERNEQGCRISWARHVVPLLANILPPLLSSGALFTLIGPLISGGETGDIVDQAESIFTQCSAILNPDMLACTFLKFIPDVIEFDGQSVRDLVDATPQGYLREFIPCWVSGSDRGTDGGPYGCHASFTEKDGFLPNGEGSVNERFLFESECSVEPLLIPKDLICTEALADGGHFNHAVFAKLGIDPIPADGLASPFPYMPFRVTDPVFVKLLWINPGPLAGLIPVPYAVEDRFGYGSLRDLNLLLAHVGGFVGPVIAGNVTAVAGPVIECFQRQVGKVTTKQITQCIQAVSSLIPTGGL